MTLGGLYPGLYALAGALETQIDVEGAEVTSTGVRVQLMATATAIECRSRITSLFVTLVEGPHVTPMIVTPRPLSPGVRQRVTSTVVEGWKRDG